jgi:glutaredoxin
MRKASGRNTVPQIIINGTHVGCSDELLSSMPKANSTYFSITTLTGVED